MTDFFKPDPHSMGTKGLVFIGDDVLVYRRGRDTKTHPGELDMPGGAPEGEETPFKTFQREVYEEFGLDIHREDIVYAKRYASVLRPGKFAWYAVAKLPERTKNKIVFGDEGTEFMLMTPKEYLARTDAWPVFQQRTADYLASLD